MTPQPPGPIPFPENPQTAAEWAVRAHLYVEALEFQKKVVNYLNAMLDYPKNAESRIAYGLPLLPMPVPPDGYTPPAPPAVVRPPAAQTVVGAPVSDPQYGIVYPGFGDPNPSGAVIDNPIKSGTETIRKVVKETPWGISNFWVDVA